MTYSTTEINRVLGKTDPNNAVNTKSSTTGKLTTDRGTEIVSANGQFDKNSFLKILSAQLSNLDPTANQDSTQYVTQMAQFSAMEQMYNLNETMTTFSYQQLVGKGATMDVSNLEGELYTGVIRGVSKDKYGTHISLEVYENGENVYKVFDVKNIQTILDVPNQTGGMSTNSDFLAASSLKNQKVVLSTYDKDDKNIIVKGTIKSVFIDNGIVKIRVETDEKDADGNLVVKEYPYSSILKAGDLTEEDMNVKPQEPPKKPEVETQEIPITTVDTENDKKTKEKKDEKDEKEKKQSEVLKMVDNSKENGYKENYEKELQRLHQIIGK